MKLIFMTGGVMSGIGKGVATASIGKILQQYGYKVTAIKIDPYVNCDAGTMRPTEHGEVWVTDDGGEIDQDLGNYERFLNMDISRKNNITTGQVYKSVIEKERAGKYLGKTVQIIPHVIDEIKDRITKAAKGYDVALIEIGGTIGDYENVPFLFAARNLQMDMGSENVTFFLISYLPEPNHIGEPKTKPTQQAIKKLNENGIIPDFILCRAENPLDDVRRKKIETYANIESEHVISAPDIEHTVYQVPLNFEEENLGTKLLKRLELEPKQQPDWSKWKEKIENLANPKNKVKIGMVGKYLDIGDYQLADSYISINESLKHAGTELNTKVDIEWIDAKQFESDSSNLEQLNRCDGIIVPGGFGSSGVEGKILAIQYARENKIPFLGLCYGLQLAVVEFARHVCDMEGAHTTEVNPDTKYPVIDILEHQKELMEKSQYGGTMRLGAYAASLLDNSKIMNLYKKTSRIKEDSKKMDIEDFRLGDTKGTLALERHRHRYEVEPQFIKKIEKNGLKFSGHHQRSDGTKLMEFIELPDHPYFVATQAHPEFKSRFGKPAPLFLGLVKAALTNN